MSLRNLCSVLFLLLASTCLAEAQSAPDPSITNTTSACNSASPYGAGCVGNFPGLIDHASKNFDLNGKNQSPSASNTDTLTTVPTTSNVSWVPFSKMLYPGYSGNISTKIVCHFQIWWVAGSHGTSLTGQDQTQAYQNQAQNAGLPGILYQRES
jgi:hypothetical protein